MEEQEHREQHGGKEPSTEAGMCRTVEPEWGPQEREVPWGNGNSLGFVSCPAVFHGLWKVLGFLLSPWYVLIHATGRVSVWKCAPSLPGCPGTCDSEDYSV